jgi:HEAT repeats
VTAVADAFPAVVIEQSRRPSRVIGRAIVLLFPAAVLALGAVSTSTPLMFWVGAGLLLLTAVVLLPQPRLAAPSTGLAVIALYILGQVWLWYCANQYHVEWYPHFAVGALLVVPLILFAAVILVRSGAHDLRKARFIAQRLRRRRDWPSDLTYCAMLPEVLALRETVQADAAPVLALLPAQAEVVRHLSERAFEPEVRAAAIRALAHTRDRGQVETIAQFLRDRSPLVRRAAAEVLFWESERRWAWARFGVHEALADPSLREDGPLPLAGATLPPQALSDLMEWSAEGGAQSVRSSVTLASYYAHAFSGGPDGELAADIRQKVLDPGAPTALRMELAQLLLEYRLFDCGHLASLLLPDQPVPLRLLAADAILAVSPDADATRALYEIARRPNREIALAVAQVIQRRLNTDLGVRTPLPPIQSRLAAEITRQVMEWAATEPPESEIIVPTSAPAVAGRPGSEWNLPSIAPRESHSPQEPSH